MSGDEGKAPPPEADQDLAELSEEDRSFVREARRRLAERQGKPPIAEEIQRRMDSESGIDTEAPPERSG